MSTVALINRRTRRRHNPRRKSSESRSARSRAAKLGWRHRRSRRHATRRNPWYGDHSGHRRAALKGWRGRRRHHVRANPRRSRRHYRRNPRSLGSMKGFINHTLIPGSVGAVGALGLDVILGYVPLPAQLQTGMFKPVVRLAGAALLGIIASKVAGRQVGEQVASGATIVVLYDVFKGVASSALPNLPLSGIEYYGAGVPVGVPLSEYVNAPALTAAPQAGIVQPLRAGMAEYVNF